jgi:hypothetical protein
VTPQQILKHLAIANRFLRQIALELVLDKNPKKTHGAKPTGVDGIFEIRVRKSWTYRTTGFASARLNYVKDVMNFSYVHSNSGRRAGGFAVYLPKKPALTWVTDSGTPTSSWIPPSGVAPDKKPAKPVKMKCIKGYELRRYPGLYAMCLTMVAGHPETAKARYGLYISHEFGHILNLGHRVEKWDRRGKTPKNPTGLVSKGEHWDNLTHPPSENVMKYDATDDVCHDLDILQALAAHASPLVPKK